MRVLMVSANTEMINMPVLPLGMACVAQAAEDAGHDVHRLNLMASTDALGELTGAIHRFDPEVIGLSVRNIDDQVSASPKFLLEPVKDIVTACRSASHAVIVLGGAGYSIFPSQTLAYLDADLGIQGEGERSFCLLLDALEKQLDLSTIPGLYHRNGSIQNRQQVVRNIDLLQLPRPDKQIWALENPGDGPLWLPIQTRRGCPLNCSYCSTSTIEGRIIRKRSIEPVLDAMQDFVAAGFDHFFFVDNTFNLPPGYAEGLCRHICRSGLKIRWRAILYPRQMDEALVALMAKAGCTEISLGFESGSNEILQRMNKRFGVKDIRRVAALLKDHGIRCMGFLMLGAPGENRRTVSESLACVDSLQLSAVKVTVGVRIYPYTALSKLARETGLIRSDNDLFQPAFFIEPDMETWIRETVAAFAEGRPNWLYG